MSIELKIKSKHLSVESKIIRFEEKKLKRAIKWHTSRQLECGKLQGERHSLWSHRTNEVRNENRATFLARAYIAGKPYHVIEQSRTPEKEYAFKTVIIPRIHAMVAKYGDKNTTREQISKWATINTENK